MYAPAFKTASSFAANERGSVAILFGLVFVVMLMMSGAAIDFGRVYSTSSAVSAAVDAAALAAGKGLLDGRLSDDDVEQMAVKYFDENLKAGGHAGNVGRPVVTLDRSTGSVSIEVNADVPTTILSIANIDQIRVPVKSSVAFEQKDIELSMALDVTGSMGGSKIADLRDATNDLIDIMLPDAGTPNKVRVALAPYDSGVNAGAYAARATNGRSTRCTFERQGTDPNGYQAPSDDNYLKIAGDTGVIATATCPRYSQVVALTNDKLKLKNSVSTYTPGGSTAGHLGAQWASYMLAPEWSGVFGGDAGAEWGDDKTIKAMVLMTDGVFNTIGGRNYGNTSAQAADSQARAEQFCKAMRDKGVLVFAVGFKMSENPSGARENAINTLKDCAGAPDRYFDAENGDTLRAAFQQIAVRLTRLRLTQ